MNMDKWIWFSVMPPIVTIALAIWSKKILPSLFGGLLVGSYLSHPTLTGGFETAADSIVKLLSDKSNLQVLLFLYLFSGLIALIKKSGGIAAFSELVEKHIKNERGVFYTLWALIPVTFIDCGFRVIGAGSIVRGLGEKHKIPKQRLAFMLNNTASPLVELIPIATTFVGFNIANINQGLKAAALEDRSAYDILLHAIPLEFFSIVALLITFLSIYFQWQKPSSGKKQTVQSNDVPKGKMKMMMQEAESMIAPRISNLIIPLFFVIGLSSYFFWHFGSEKVAPNSSLSQIIGATDANKAMLVALLISIAITGSAYFFQKYKIGDMTVDFISGGNEIVNTLTILTLAWSLAAVSQDLGLSELVRQQLGGSLPGWSVPVSLFVLSSAITYFIGSGWGSSSLIMPFAIPLAVSTGSAIPVCVAAVITGGTFGDVTSPVAGMTNMASGVIRTDQMGYLKYASPYNFVSAGIAAILFLITAIFF
jgi:tetracycline resistance efflux pump